MRQVLHLDDAACPATGPVGSEKLKHPTGTAISADGLLHSLILPDGGLGKLLAEQEHLLQLRRRGLQDLGHFLFAEGIHLQTVVREPLLHLDHAVGILQRGQVLHGIGELLPGAGVHVDGLLHQIHIQRHASVVYLLIEAILTPYFFRDRELGQPVLDGLFDLHVPAVIAFEGSPLVRRVHRQVPGPATVGLRRRTGLAEVFDEVLALRELLLVQPQHGTDAFQGERQAHRGGPDHGAVPSCRVQIVADRILRNAVAGIVEAAVVPEPA